MYIVSLAITIFIPICNDFNPIVLTLYATLSATVNVFLAWCVVENRRKRIALYALVRPVLSLISVVFFGLATEDGEYFLLSQLIALLVTFLAIFSSSLKIEIIGLRGLVGEIWGAKNVIFPYVIDGFIHGLASNAIFLAVAWTSSPEVAALYFFADKVFQALSQVLIESERPIYLQRYLSLSSADVAVELFKRIDFRIIKLGALGFLISLTSIPYIAVINSWPQGLYLGILCNLFLLWFLKFYLIRYVSFAIVFKLPWYVLCQSLLNLFTVTFAFSLQIKGNSVVPTLVLIVLTQYLAQIFLVLILKRFIGRVH
jgi:hypothetical protein